jgi:hypothetical protein
VKQYRITESQIKTLGGVIQECLANEIKPTQPPVEPPIDNPDDPPVIPPPPTGDYPTPHGVNVVRPGDFELSSNGTFSTRHETPVEAARRLGWPGTGVDEAMTFDGWDFPRFAAANLKPGSRIDMTRCTFRDQRRNALDINFFGDTNAGQDYLTGRPGGLDLRIYDSLFARNYSPNPNTADEHSVASFVRSRAVDYVRVSMYNCLHRYSGAGPDRAATAGLTDHDTYIQGRGKRLITRGNCWIDGAAQCAKGGWEFCFHDNFFAANYATFGFFGPDKGETDKFGEFTTGGGLFNGIIYGMSDIEAHSAPHAYGLILNGGCDITLQDLHIVNPNPTYNVGRPLHAIHCKNQGGRPMKVTFKNVHVYGYDSVFGGDQQFVDTGTMGEVHMHHRLPDLDLNVMRQLLDSGEMRPDQARAYAAEKLGVAG